MKPNNNFGNRSARPGRKLSWVVTVAMISIISIVAISQGRTPNRRGQSPGGEVAPVQAPDFNIKDSDGKNVKLSDLKGKVVVLDFWATWCVPCRQTMPLLDKLQAKYRDQGLVILGISLDEEGWTAVRPFLKAKGVKYRIALADKALLDKYDDISGLPTALFIDRDGKIRARHEGLVSNAVLENQIKKLL